MEFITGMDTRIGYPNEHMAGGSDEGLSSPVFATAVGLVIEGLQKKPVIHSTAPEEVNPQNDETVSDETLEPAETRCC